MKILSINSVPYGSTAKIMLGISKVAKGVGGEVFMSCGYSYHPMKEIKNRYIKIGGMISKKLHIIATQFTGLHGFFSRIATDNFLRKIKKIKPDIIHLHNLHGWYINLPKLFKYIKKNNIRIIWTLHDCWSFTGQCPHFDMIGCDKWKTGCYRCPQIHDYPKTYVDRSKLMYKKKKEWFTGIKDMTIVTPSQWLATLVKQSFLKEYPVQVINNGIDLSVFKPTESSFRKRYALEDKFILLGVAFGWGKRKGLDVFIELSKRLNENYQIVLVGTNDRVDKQLPDNIISIHRTQNQTELAEIYTAADVFVNPTREENYPTVNMEALACGTPVVTFKTGGSPEIIDETCGLVVEKNDIDGLQKSIEDIYQNHPFTKENCLNKARNFDMNEKFAQYVAMYEANEIRSFV